MNRKRNLWIVLVLALVVALALGACKKAEPAPEVVEPEPAPSDEGEVPEISQPIARWNMVVDQLWVLVAYGDAGNPSVVDEGIVISAVFDEMDLRVSGSAGCNNYFSSYAADDDGNLTIEGPIGVTMMACETGMEEEAAYLAALETVSGYVLTEEGRLELAYDSGQPYDEKLVFAPGQAALYGGIWRLVSFGDPDDLQELEEGTSITAVFSPETDTTGTLGGNATCNNYTTSYEIDENNIRVGPIAGTMMMCEVGADQEAAYLASLESAQTFEIVGPYLQMAYDGGVLNYSSVDLPLENVLWQAVVVLGQPVPEEVEITALFTPGEEAGTGMIGGNAGCNSYNGSYEVSGNQLSVPGPFAMTMMMCPDEELAELERTYLAALETAEGYDVLGDQMVVHTADGDVQYAADREPLEGTYWVLVSWGDIDSPREPEEGSSFTAVFSRLPVLPTGTVVGTTGCNDYNATYTANVNEIKINLPSKTNNEDCPWGAGNYEVEQQFFLGLNSATTYRIVGGLLQIPYGDAPSQQVLNFVASEPPVAPVLDLSPLDDTFWYLASIGDAAVLPGVEATAHFQIDEGGSTGAMSGSAGCNSYNTTIGENFQLGPIVTTRKACEQPVMDQETTYLDWLSGAYTYSRAGDQLLISTAKGVLTYHSQPILDQRPELQEKSWHLISYEQATPVAGYNPTALFSADGTTVSGRTGCNDFTGTYAAEQGNTLSVGALASTKKACASDDLNQQEQVYLELLSKAVSYSVNGTSLQVLTSAGGTLIYSSVAPEGPQAPKAVIQGPNLAEMGEVLGFDGTASTAGSLPIVGYSWDMGDGAKLSGPQVQYAYDKAGAFTVQLTVTDQGGLQGSATLSVQITPVVAVEPPTAVIYGPSLGETGQALTFDGSGSKPGTAAIVSYSWTMGDGTTLEGTSVQYTYSQPGSFEVTLTVTDQAGESSVAKHPVQITPVVEVSPPKAAIEGPPEAFVGDSVALSAAGSQQGTGEITGYSWQSGDGNNTGPVGENTFTTIYGHPGTYYAAVTVVDANGLQDSASMAIVIHATLEGNSWILGNTIPGTSITVEFANGNLSGFAGCNSYSATYTSTRAGGTSNNITVGPITISQAMCSEEIMNQEQAYIAMLQAATAYTINGASLTLATPSGPLTYGAAVPMPVVAH